MAPTSGPAIFQFTALTRTLPKSTPPPRCMPHRDLQLGGLMSGKCLSPGGPPSILSISGKLYDHNSIAGPH